MNLIYQVKVGKTPQFYDICIDSVTRYCERYNLEHIVQVKPILKIKPICNHRQNMKLGYLPIFEKENAFNYLDTFDKICIIDADIYIRDNTPNIFDEIQPEIVFAGVIEAEMPLTTQYRTKVQKFSIAQYKNLQDAMTDWTPDKGVPFFNMGLMLFTKKLATYLNGDSPEQFIRRKEFEKFVNGEGHHKWSTDQTLLNYWVRKNKMSTKRISWKWNALFKAVEDQKLPESYFIHFFLADNLPKRGNEIPQLINNLSLANQVKGHG